MTQNDFETGGWVNNYNYTNTSGSIDEGYQKKLGIKKNLSKKSKFDENDMNDLANPDGQVYKSRRIKKGTDPQKTIVLDDTKCNSSLLQKAKLYGIVGLFYEYLDKLDDAVKENYDVFENAGKMNVEEVIFNFNKVFVGILNDSKRNLNMGQKKQAIALLQNLLRAYQNHSLENVENIYTSESWVKNDLDKRLSSMKHWTLNQLKKDLKLFIVSNLTSFSDTVRSLLKTTRPSSAPKYSQKDTKKLKTKHYNFNAMFDEVENK